MAEECALIGAEEICGYLRWSRAKLFSRLPRMKKHGCIFKQWVGRPPKKMLTAYPSELNSYLRHHEAV